MTKWGKVDFKELRDLEKRLGALSNVDIDAFFNDCARELVARLLSKVIRRTPVGQYPPSSGKQGGTLRRGWTADSQEAAAGKTSTAKAWAETAKIEHIGNLYQIEVINPVEYASYVEFGHRTANHKGWVTGRFMLTISEDELDGQIQKILEKKITRFLEETFNGK